MELRMLGRSGLQVSPLCLGGNVFGWTLKNAKNEFYHGGHSQVAH
jgi:aryl-alcohol dehydrogenase-like predicted oxidoreductase